MSESSKMNQFWEETSGLMTAVDLSSDFYYDDRAEKQVESFVYALEKLIELGDSSTSNLSSRGINLQGVLDLTNDFKAKRTEFIDAEKETMNKLDVINNLFKKVNSIGLQNRGSLGVQQMEPNLIIFIINYRNI